ncbi:hypothetical protein MTIV3_ORF5 [Metallosphaera turreted icosahedral virus 3]|nr:hypothetical protein MTIV3_ORF5 [Metallosphaera turreted icosahedral virus 3]
MPNIQLPIITLYSLSQDKVRVSYLSTPTYKGRIRIIGYNAQPTKRGGFTPKKDPDQVI